MTSLCSSDLNCGLFQFPLCIYFLCQRGKPHILHSLSNCTGNPSGNGVKKYVMCYTPSVQTSSEWTRRSITQLLHGASAVCSDGGVIPWFLTAVAWSLGMGVAEVQRMVLGLTITHIPTK
jgi:hypothetical protein